MWVFFMGLWWPWDCFGSAALVQPSLFELRRTLDFAIPRKARAKSVADRVGLATLALRLFSACWPRSRTAFSSQHDIFISKGALGGLPPEALA
jgi:hypothetical protein